MGASPERCDEVGATISVDPRDHRDLHALGEELVEAVVHRRAERGRMPFSEIAIRVVHPDESEISPIVTSQFIEDVVHVRVCGTDDSNPRHGRQ